MDNRGMAFLIAESALYGMQPPAANSDRGHGVSVSVNGESAASSISLTGVHGHPRRQKPCTYVGTFNNREASQLLCISTSEPIVSATPE